MATPRGQSSAASAPTGGGHSAGPRRPSLLINALSNWSALGVNVVIGLLLTPFVIHSLGASGYGIWTLVGAIMGYYGLLDLGVGSAVTRYVARFAGQKDDRALNETLATSLVMFSIVGLAVPGLAVLSMGPLAAFFRVDPTELSAFRWTFLLLSVSMSLNLPGQVFRATLRAHEHFVVRNSISVASALLRAALAVWLLSQGVGLVALAVAYLLAECLGLTAHVVTVRRMIPDARFDVRLARFSMVKTLLTYGLSTTVVMVGAIALNHLDAVVIGRMIGLEAVAVYGVAALILRYYRNLLHGGAGVLTPRFARLQGSGEWQRLRELLLRSLWLCGLLSFGAGLGLLTVGPPFIAAWVGPDYADAATVLAILVVAACFSLAQHPATVALYAINKHHYFAAAIICEALLNLVLSVILARHLGIVGVALGTMIPSLLLRIVVQPLYVCRLVGVQLSSYVRPLAVTASTALAALGLWRLCFMPAVAPDGLVGCAWLGLQVTAVYAGCVGLVFGPWLLRQARSGRWARASAGPRGPAAVPPGGSLEDGMHTRKLELCELSGSVEKAGNSPRCAQHRTSLPGG